METPKRRDRDHGGAAASSKKREDSKYYGRSTTPSRQFHPTSPVPLDQKSASVLQRRTPLKHLQQESSVCGWSIPRNNGSVGREHHRPSLKRTFSQEDLDLSDPNFEVTHSIYLKFPCPPSAPLKRVKQDNVNVEQTGGDNITRRVVRDELAKYLSGNQKETTRKSDPSARRRLYPLPAESHQPDWILLEPESEKNSRKRRLVSLKPPAFVPPPPVSKATFQRDTQFIPDAVNVAPPKPEGVLWRTQAVDLNKLDIERIRQYLLSRGVPIESDAPATAHEQIYVKLRPATEQVMPIQIQKIEKPKKKIEEKQESTWATPVLLPVLLLVGALKWMLG